MKEPKEPAEVEADFKKGKQKRDAESKQSLQRAGPVCKKNPVKCGAAMAAAAYVAYRFYENNRDATEKQTKCIADCLPKNWHEYVSNACAGMYWEGYDGPIDGLNDVSDDVIVANIRNHSYSRLDPTGPFLDASAWAGMSKGDVFCDLAETQIPVPFGPIPFDASYVVVDAVVFVPSVRMQPTTDEGVPTCAAGHDPWATWVGKAADYRGADQGLGPCASCEQVCEETYPTTFGDTMLDSMKDLMVDGPLSALGAGLTALGLDPKYLAIAGYVALVVAALFAKGQLETLIGKPHGTYVFLALCALIAYMYLTGRLTMPKANQRVPDE
jgi:hypothetical protein